MMPREYYSTGTIRKKFSLIRVFVISVDFYRLVLDESKCTGKLFFRLAENITAIIVDERVKFEAGKRGIKGIFFYASGQWAG